jgi:hypothetical protein
MTILTREQMAAVLPVKRELVEMPEFGEGAGVYVYGLTAREKADYDASMMKPDMTAVDKRKAKEMKPRLIIAAVRDNDGKQIFTLDDVAMINAWPSSVLERVHDVAHRLCNGKSIEELEKNSDETQTD